MSQIYKSPNGGGGIVDSVTGGPGILASPTTGNVVVSLANYTALSTTTTNATPNTSMSISLGSTPGTYTLDINVSAYDSTNTAGAGFSIFGAVRTTGSAGVLLGFDDTIQYSDAVDVDLVATLTVSGNNAIVEVTGLASTNIAWTAITFYTFAT